MARCALTRGLGALLLLSSVLVPQAFATEAPVVAAAWEDATLVHLLSPSLAESVGLKPLTEFEVVDGLQVILLTSDGNLFDLTRRLPLPAKTPLQVTSFAVSEGLLVAVRNGRLGWYEDGEIRERIELPSKGMRVVAGKKQRLYLYGPRERGSVVYLLEEGKVLPLLETPQGTISAFTAIGERVFFAIDNAIYTAARGDRPGLLFIATGEQSIRSLAADPVAGLLYFSTGDTVYAMRAGVAISVLRGLAGVLRYSGNALFVLDPDRKRLVKVLGLEKLTTVSGGATAPATPPGAFKE
jgi:hypothetical protein